MYRAKPDKHLTKEIMMSINLGSRTDW